MLHRCQEDQNRAQGRGSPSLTHHRGAVVLVVVPGWAGSSAAGPGQHLAASQAGFFSLDLMGLKKNHSKKGRTYKIKQEKHRCRAYSLIAFSPPLQGSVAAALPQPRGISALPGGLGVNNRGRGAVPPPQPPCPSASPECFSKLHLQESGPFDEAEGHFSPLPPRQHCTGTATRE